MQAASMGTAWGDDRLKVKIATVNVKMMNNGDKGSWQAGSKSNSQWLCKIRVPAPYIFQLQDYEEKKRNQDYLALPRHIFMRCWAIKCTCLPNVPEVSETFLMLNMCPLTREFCRDLPNGAFTLQALDSRGHGGHHWTINATSDNVLMTSFIIDKFNYFGINKFLSHWLQQHLSLVRWMHYLHRRQPPLSACWHMN